MLAPVDRDARRQRYVKAVWRIAERDGAEHVSMRAIAAEAGTSVGMLQHHFTDKDEILVAAIRSRLEAKSAQLAAPWPPWPGARSRTGTRRRPSSSTAADPAAPRGGAGPDPVARWRRAFTAQDGGARAERSRAG